MNHKYVLKYSAIQTIAFGIHKLFSLLFYLIAMVFGGAEQLGLFFFGFSLIMPFNIVVYHLSFEVIPVFFNKTHNTAALLWRWLLLLAVITGIASLILVAVLNTQQFSKLKPHTLLFLTFLPFITLAYFSTAFLDASHRFTLSATVTVVASLSRVLLLLTLLPHLNAQHMWLAFLSFYVVQALAFIFPLSHMLKSPIISLTPLISELSFAIKGSVVRGVEAIIGWVDVFLLSLFAPLAFLGSYGTFRLIAMSLYSLFSWGFSKVLLPTLSRNEHSSNWEIVAIIMTHLTITLFTVTTFLIPLIFHFLPSYQPYTYLFPLLFAFFVFRAIGKLPRLQLQARTDIDAVFKWSLVESIINVVLDLLLIPTIGGVGAAIASLVAALVGESFFLAETNNAHIVKTLFTPAMALITTLLFISQSLALSLSHLFLVLTALLFILYLILLKQLLEKHGGIRTFW